jgi:hypothetical protein
MISGNRFHPLFWQPAKPDQHLSNGEKDSVLPVGMNHPAATFL